MRRGRIRVTIAIAAMCGALTVVGVQRTMAGASTDATSPFPAVLVMRYGLAESSSGRSAPWGSPMARSQVKLVGVNPWDHRVEWGVWQQSGAPALFPVRSRDGGRHWAAAGPMLATDWAGGAVYYVDRVITESSSAVVMVSNAVIDLTTDSGHRWYQYVNGADNWSITRSTVTGGIGIRVSPASYAQLPKGAFAIYRLDLARHRWLRVGESLR